MKGARRGKQETKRCDSVHLVAAVSVEKKYFIVYFISEEILTMADTDGKNKSISLIHTRRVCGENKLAYGWVYVGSLEEKLSAITLHDYCNNRDITGG